MLLRMDFDNQIIICHLFQNCIQFGNIKVASRLLTTIPCPRNKEVPGRRFNENRIL